MSESAIKASISDALKAAMKAQDKPRRDALRLMQAEFKRVEVDERIVLDDARVLAILDKMAKQRRESIAQFEKGGRQDLVDIENAELAIIQEFLPQALTEAEIDALVEAAMAQTGAATVKDMGKVMAELKARHGSQLDMSKASGLVKQALA